MTSIKFNEDCLLSYMASAPFALAFERALECRVYSRWQFRRPVLDLGCGDGLFAKVLFREKIDTGADPNAAELRRAQKLGVYAELIQCAGDSIPKPDACYGTVFSNSVLEHIPDLEPVLREVCRILVRGGTFYFTAPSDFFDRYTVANQVLMGLGLSKLAMRYRRSYNSFWKHYNCRSVEGWVELAGKAGFEVIESHAYGPKRVCLLDDVLVPVALPGLLMKRLTGRWALCPSVRHVAIRPFHRLAETALRGGERASEGGLVFVALRKADR